jgi:hypothetical protein
MTDELELDLGEDNSEEIINRKDKRIKSLSEKYESSEKEKAELAKAKEEAEAKATAAQKDADFFKGFSQVSSKYQGAGEYQDKIREKVMAGYDVEDAAISILAKEGKLQGAPTPTPRDTAAGGSASMGITGGMEKSPDEMTQDERLATLKDMESKGELRL